ncbi:MAG: PAS domain-containing sensor histidine kinase [Acidimicrobiales bacterium]
MTEIDLDRLPDAVLVLDEDRTVVAMNSAALDMLGHDAIAFVGQPVGKSFDVRSPGGVAALRTGLPSTEGLVDLVFLRADGTDVSVTATIRSGSGTIVIAMRPSGERSGIAIISTVAHELRSPLTSVKGYTALMLNRWDRLEDGQKRTMLEHVHHDAIRVTRLVTELLDISRLETGRLVLRRQMVDLPALARSVVEKVGMAIPELDCTAVFPADLPQVYADPDKVEQVLTNLVENAAKYGSPKAMRVTGEVGTASVAVTVRDTGRGIAAADLPHVFTKFFRRDHGRPSGTGLGLWISRGLVEAHGGQLTAVSTLGEGSTFRFTLPIVASDREPGGEPIGEPLS